MASKQFPQNVKTEFPNLRLKKQNQASLKSIFMKMIVKKNLFLDWLKKRSEKTNTTKEKHCKKHLSL